MSRRPEIRHTSAAFVESSYRPEYRIFYPMSSRFLQNIIEYDTKPNILFQSYKSKYI